MTRQSLASATLLALAFGCSRPAPVGEVAVPVIAEPPATPPATPTTPPTTPPTPVTPAPPAKPEAFKLPNDRGGRAVARLGDNAITPPRLELAKPTPRVAAGPQGRLELTLPPPAPPTQAPRPAATPVVLAAATPRPPGISPPPERVPLTLGDSVALDPAAVKLAERPAPVFAEVEAPSPTGLPRLARQTPDRAATDDPTADIAAQRAVFTPRGEVVVRPFGVALTLPDPFEFVAHLRGKLGSDVELGTTPQTAVPLMGKP